MYVSSLAFRLKTRAWPIKRHLVEQSVLLFVIPQTPLSLFVQQLGSDRGIYWILRSCRVYSLANCKLHCTFTARDNFPVNLHFCSDRQHCLPWVQPRSTVHSLQATLISRRQMLQCRTNTRKRDAWWLQSRRRVNTIHLHLAGMRRCRVCHCTIRKTIITSI